MLGEWCSSVTERYKTFLVLPPTHLGVNPVLYDERTLYNVDLPCFNRSFNRIQVKVLRIQVSYQSVLLIHVNNKYVSTIEHT